MHSYVQIVCTPTADTPGACLLLHFDNRRYLFGRLGEGTQRLMVQRKLSLAKIQDIFLTGFIDWQTSGGLLGMILSVADVQAVSKASIELTNAKLRSKGKAELKKPQDSHLRVHGGRNLMHMLASSRRFIFRKGLPLRPRELRHDPRSGHSNLCEPDYEDDNVRVWSIPVSKRPEKKASNPGHQSPKRRKLSASSGTDSDSAPEDPSSDEADQTIREGVVRDMFDSEWALDTLHETKLQDVQLPAKIFVRNEKGHIEPYEGPLPGGLTPCPDITVLVRKPWPAAKVEQLPDTRPSKQSMCYIVKTHPRRGKFDVKAATSYGVAKTDFKKLTAGETVTGKDGVAVTPQMVLGPAIEGHGFAIADVGAPDLVDGLLSRPEWSNAEIMQGIDAMYWIFPEAVSDTDISKVVDFMKAHSSIKHIVLGTEVSPNIVAQESATAQLIQMHRIDPDRFPLPIFDNEPPSRHASALASVAEVGRPGAVFQIAPKVSFPTDSIVPLMDTALPIRELASQGQHILDLADAARKKIAEPAFLSEVEESQKNLPRPDVEIIPLGTGSALPSKYRNVSATLIRVPGWGSYLLDCGENTLGQLRRCFGYEGADGVLMDLRAICISHAHADHHLGTIGVLARWRELNVGPHDLSIAIVAAPKYQEFLREYDSVQHLNPRGRPRRVVPVTLHSPAGGRPIPGTTLAASFPPWLNDTTDRDSLRLPRIDACFVDHCYEAAALVLTFPDSGLKIAYSGDCRPSDAFARLGRGAHLLVHECTFEDELAGDALAKKHCTLSEALGVGRKMGARRILLTHFSQRYPKLPVVNEEAALFAGEGGNGNGNGNWNGNFKGKGQQQRDVEVLFAFDMMRVKLGEFKQAKQFLPALRELLEEGEEEGDEGEEREELLNG
ncbi:hypothetical protein VTK56DRAFT_5163 [Thermocarpiscus australiensis]